LENYAQDACMIDYHVKYLLFCDLNQNWVVLKKIAHYVVSWEKKLYVIYVPTDRWMLPKAICPLLLAIQFFFVNIFCPLLFYA
jgi:hypothetical protein